MATMNIFGQTLIIALLFFGAVQCFFGYRIFRFTAPLSGFLTGSILGGIAGLAVSAESGALMMAILLGSLFSWLAYRRFPAGVFAQCFQAGSLMALLYLILSSVLRGSFQSLAGTVSAEGGIGLLIGLVSGICGVLLSRPAVICSAATCGGSLIGISLMLLKGNPGYLLLGIVAAIFGIFFQIFMAHAQSEHEDRERAYEFSDEEAEEMENMGHSGSGRIAAALGLAAFLLCMALEAGVSIAVVAIVLMLIFSVSVPLAVRVVRS